MTRFTRKTCWFTRILVSFGEGSNNFKFLNYFLFLDDESNKMDARSESSNEDIYDGFEDDESEDEGIKNIIKNGMADIGGDSDLSNDEEYEQMEVS